MREILYRGKQVDSDKWIYGYLSKARLFGYKGNTLQPCIDHEDKGVMLSSVIDPDTVGQWTGLCDKSGKKIFEDDIVSNEWCGMCTNSIVKYGKYKESDMSDDYQCGHYGFYIKHKEIEKYVRHDLFFFADKCEIIGNIHDNPELLEVTDVAEI